MILKWRKYEIRSSILDARLLAFLAFPAPSLSKGFFCTFDSISILYRCLNISIELVNGKTAKQCKKISIEELEQSIYDRNRIELVALL